MHTMFGFKSATRQAWNNPAKTGDGIQAGHPWRSGRRRRDASHSVFQGQAGLTPYGVQDGKVANGGQYNDTRMITPGLHAGSRASMNSSLAGTTGS